MNGSRLHHVGIVVSSIQDTAPLFAGWLGVEWSQEITHDPLQRVRVSFLPSNDPTQSTLELVEPAGSRSPVQEFLDNGGGLHHVCYEVEDLNAHIAASTANGATLVRFPLPAAAFGGRKIAWIVTPQKHLVEFLSKT